jgi:hypothetical protein
MGHKPIYLELIKLKKLPGNQAHEKVAVAKLANAQAVQQCPDLSSSASNFQLSILHHCHKIKKNRVSQAKCNARKKNIEMIFYRIL